MQEKIKNFLKNIKMNESFLSMILGIVTVLVVGFLVVNYWRQNRPADINGDGEKTKQGVTEMINDVSVVDEGGEKFPSELPKTYTVQRGDHLWKIAEENYGSGYNWVDIARENDLRDPNVLLVGQELELPRSAVKIVEKEEVEDPATTLKPGQSVIEGDRYIVEKGDTLWDIAVRAYQDGYKWPELAAANDIENPDIIEVGMELNIPRD